MKRPKCLHCHRAVAGDDKTCRRHRVDGSLADDTRSNGRKRPASGCLTQGEWLAIYDSQRGQCALCRHLLWNRFSGEPRIKGKERIAAVDHCHIIEKEKGTRASIRGLLCAYPCNRILRREMDAGWLDRAAEYVDSLPAQAVLRG